VGFGAARIGVVLHGDVPSRMKLDWFWGRN
jgi:hypothetical protein